MLPMFLSCKEECKSQRCMQVAFYAHYKVWIAHHVMSLSLLKVVAAFIILG